MEEVKGGNNEEGVHVVLDDAPVAPHNNESLFLLVPQQQGKESPNQIYLSTMDEMIKKLKPLKRKGKSYKSSLNISREILKNRRRKKQQIAVSMGNSDHGTPARRPPPAQEAQSFVSEIAELQAKIYLFGNEQQKMDWEAGDLILKEFVVDKGWTTMHECMRLFKIGSERFKRIKSGRLKTSATKNRGGQLQLHDSLQRDAIFLLFIRFSNRCFADDNEPLMTNSINHVIPNKPNVKKWGSVMDVFEDYLYFHSKSGWNYMLPFGRTTFYRKLQHHPDIFSIIQQNIIAK
jgi:hypothetical protein